MLPPATYAGGRRICMTAFATVVLPQPDSPASPTTSPARIVRSMPSTARTLLAPAAYSTASCRSSTSVSRGRVGDDAPAIGSPTFVTPGALLRTSLDLAPGPARPAHLA